VHGLWPKVNLLAGRLARRRGLPFVLTLHGMLHHAALHQKRLKKLVGMYLIGYRELVTGAAAVHVLNAAEQREAEGPRLPARVVEVPNGIFPEEFETLPARGAFRASVPGLGDAPFVLSLARLHVQKGPDLLLEAFARLAATHPDLHLVFAGPDQGAGALLSTESARRGLTGRVHLVGPRYGPARIEALVDATVFCLPSRQEGFSMAITEALAAGAPAVVTDRCHFPEVGSVGCGRVTTLEPADLARGLAEVLAEPDAGRALGARGRALVFERYTWPRICNRMEALYAEVTR
jgi:glycosyltransferase involved in cell wall biosynthesis